jgi:branched-chain amino acid transport system ATP-binding protein
MSMLKTENLSAAYGSINALRNINFEVNEGEIVAIIGANGAGKTTLLSCLSGLLAFSGRIIYNGETYTGRINSGLIVTKGVVQVPEGRQIFPELSVWDNMKMGAYTRSSRDKINEEIENLFSYFPVLKERRHQKGGSLSGGEQQMLAIARALISKPKLLLLDEPSMGLAPVIVANVFKIISRLHEEKMTIILIEQNAKLALKIADRAYVIESGEIHMSGPAQELANDDRIKALYLGG